MSRARWAALGLLLALVAVAAVACGTARAADPSASPVVVAVASISSESSAANGAPSTSGSLSADPSPTVSPKPTPTQPVALGPAKPGADPLSLLAWLFTPIFQGLFLLLAALYMVTGNVVVAIVIMTLLIRLLTMRLSAKQIVSQKRMQMLAPELRELTKELQRRYKGDRQAVYAATQAFYKERGVSPTAGCLPSILQMGLLFPMYWVIRDGLTNFDPSAMLTVFGAKLPLTCGNVNVVTGAVNKFAPCINSSFLGVDMGQPQKIFDLNLGFFILGVSAIAIVSALLQFVQSRMLMPPAAESDPSASSQRTMMIFLPFISILYGGFLPAGLFIYWITTSVFSLVQQFLIVGWGSMFPLFGWTPFFARGYTPRFPVSMPQPSEAGKSLAATRLKPVERAASAASTVRPNAQRRQSRRGRRR